MASSLRRATLPRFSLLIAAAGIALGASAHEPPPTPEPEPPPQSRFQKVTLNQFPGEPISLAVLPDLRVLHTARNGRVRIHDPRTGLNRTAADIPVYQHDEEGVQGIALDPDFARNRWVYVYYSPVLGTPVDDPSTPDVNEGDAPRQGTAADWARFRGVMRLSRFKLRGDVLDLGSEQRILDVPVDRGICCHIGGQIDFDGRGNLLLSTGDDTDPFESGGFTPIDERPERNPAFDAQRSAANTNDLRGKLLRIRVRGDGSYDIPEGNLFGRGVHKARPEIYAMGLRNPFRFAVNRRTDEIYLADYAPDSPVADPARGPAGHGKWAVIRRPGNYGWPYCATAELPYVDYDFATGSSGRPFDCRRPVNDSPRNTGHRVLPPVVQPDVWYSNAESPEFPELGTGGVGPMGGPAYDFDPRSPSTVKWPRYYDGVPLFYEWTRDYVKEFRLKHHPRRLDEIRPVLPSFVFDNPIDMEFGPDGALYVLEYGDGFFAENPDAQLARIDFVRENFTPVPLVAADRSFGHAPLTVTFSSAGTNDPDGDALVYAWDFDADGSVDSTEPNPVHTYASNGAFQPTLKVTDATGRSAAASARIVVGNTPPLVEFVTPAFGQPVRFGDAVPYEVRVTDDSPVDCRRVSVTYVLAHDDHGHPLSTSLGCTGTIQTQLDPGHGGSANLFVVFVAQYTDLPDDRSVPPLSGTGVVVLFPVP
jgi:cytochrome c